MKPILVFDSGVGALSIFDAIAAQLPAADLVYVCDNAAFPYGTKSENFLLERVHAVLDTCIARIDPQLIVVACNTASTVALPRLRHHYALPIVGVVPAIKPAALHSQNQVIGLLATPATVQRPYTDQLIAQFAGHCTVLRVGSSELVQIAEAKLRGQPVDNAALQRILQPFFSGETHPDQIVLGCTHFPLLNDELTSAIPAALRHSVQWVDSGEAIARRVAQLATEPGSGKGHRLAVFTRADADIEQLYPALSARGMGTPDIIAINSAADESLSNC